ncbi:DUF6191 domain-containing protein [Actinokineospora enzanensis]|uniref:DUF6191 domain-containing protein n=1 Tax=Actinokineospora enzanensis TaxID=155975 RepID=UPI000380D278|nr:DUF6191 domain-containing protein [Actinokineospora enzanensis]
MGVLWAMSLPGLVVGLIVFAAIERFGPRRRSRAGTPMSAAGFDELGAMFYGSKREEIEYRQSSLMHRDDEEDGAPPRDSADLDGYGVRIVRRRAD